MSRIPLEAYAFDARFGKRSVIILDPRLILPMEWGLDLLSLTPLLHFTPS